MAVEESITKTIGRKGRNPENQGLPVRWKIAHGAYYYRVPPGEEKSWGGKKMYRLGKTREEADATFNQFQKSGTAPINPDEVRNFRFRAPLWEKLGYQKGCGISIGMLQSIYTGARSGADKRGIPFLIHPRDIVNLANQAGGRCMLTGIEWNNEFGRTSTRPWRPSLDRINSDKGYITGNIRLVCLSVNYALNQFGDKVLMKIALAMVSSNGTFPQV